MRSYAAATASRGGPSRGPLAAGPPHRPPSRQQQRFSTLLATVLSRHPCLSPADRQEVWDRHPAERTPGGGRRVPAAHEHAVHGPSVFLNAGAGNHRDLMRADGRTVLFHPAPADVQDGKLDTFVGRDDVTLLAFLGGQDYRQGRVKVLRTDARTAYDLVLLQPASPNFAFFPPPSALRSQDETKLSWADMVDDE